LPKHRNRTISITRASMSISKSTKHLRAVTMIVTLAFAVSMIFLLFDNLAATMKNYPRNMDCTKLP